MKKRILAGLALLALAAAFGAACGGDSDNDGGAVNPPAQPAEAAASALQDTGSREAGITVSAQGTATLKPDVALISMGVSVLGSTASAAREQAAGAMDSLLGSVRANGVTDSDVQTTQFSLAPEYNYSGNVPYITGYRVMNMVSVKVRDLDSVAKVIDDAVEAAGNQVQISGVSFTVDNPAGAIGEARAQAMASARAKAEELAKAGGVTLGGPVSIVESSGGMPRDPIYRDSAMSASGEASTPIQPGQLEVNVSVEVTYSIS